MVRSREGSSRADPGWQLLDFRGSVRLARGQDSARTWRDTAERLMAKRGGEEAPGEQDMVAAMPKARPGD